MILRSISKTLKRWCWRCGYSRNEYFGLRIFFENRGRCFFCRIDALDAKYGPSEYAKQWYKIRGYYDKPSSTRYERLFKRRMY